jgi:hypothetical protein
LEPRVQVWEEVWEVLVWAMLVWEEVWAVLVWEVVSAASVAEQALEMQE